MSHELSITAIGADRPGVVAAVTAALSEVEANLEDTSMTILGGRFAMVLIVAVPDVVDIARVEDALAAPARDLGLDVSVHATSGSAAAVGERWHVSVYGADRPGIVHRFAQELAEHDVNITDLATRVIGDAVHPVYAMLLDVTVPEGVDVRELERRLHEVAADLGVECSAQPSDADIL